MSSGQSTTATMDLEDKLEHAESTHFPCDHDDSEPVGWICGFTKIGPVIQVRVTYSSEHHGIETQEKPMLNNGSLYWTVISRGPNQDQVACAGWTNEDKAMDDHGGEVAYTSSWCSAPTWTDTRGSVVGKINDEEAHVWQALWVALMLVKTHGNKSMVTTLCVTTSQRLRVTSATQTNAKENRGCVPMIEREMGVTRRS